MIERNQHGKDDVEVFSKGNLPEMGYMEYPAGNNSHGYKGNHPQLPPLVYGFKDSAKAGYGHYQKYQIMGFVNLAHFFIHDVFPHKNARKEKNRDVAILKTTSLL